MKTPLYDCHAESGAKFAPYADFLMPSYYGGATEEHHNTRQKAGLFDISHMTRFLLEGSHVVKDLQRPTTNDCTHMFVGQARYSLFCNEQGGIVDHALIYKLADRRYLLVASATNRVKDADWITRHLKQDTKLVDATDQLAQITIQGPAAASIIGKLAEPQHIPADILTANKKSMVANVPCLLSKTTQTGEDGFELFCKSEDAPDLWRALLRAGDREGLSPCGLASFNSLRIEAAIPVYGQELSEDITPWEAGLFEHVEMRKRFFIGKESLAGRKVPRRTKVGLRVIGQAIARSGDRVHRGGNDIGYVTSGEYCPSVDGHCALAFVDNHVATHGFAVSVVATNRKTDAVIVPLPFYKR